MTMPTNHIQFVNMLHACVDLSDHPKGVTLESTIKAEKHVPFVSQAVVEDWLRGLPSACSIPFVNGEIEDILMACGKGDLSVDEYWSLAARWVTSFALTPDVYPLKEEVKEEIQWTRIRNDSNGNPRYVCHFLNLNTREELDKSGDEWIPVSEKYALAVQRAKRIGGKRFHNKQYGGGIVFQCYGPSDINPIIEQLMKDSK